MNKSTKHSKLSERAKSASLLAAAVAMAVAYGTNNARAQDQLDVLQACSASALIDQLASPTVLVAEPQNFTVEAAFDGESACYYRIQFNACYMNALNRVANALSIKNITDEKKITFIKELIGQGDFLGKGYIAIKYRSKPGYISDEVVNLEPWSVYDNKAAEFGIERLISNLKTAEKICVSDAYSDDRLYDEAFGER